MKHNRITAATRETRTTAAARKRPRTNKTDGPESLMAAAAAAGKELVDRVLRGPELSVTRSIPLALIDPSPFQSREEFPEAEIRSLADSIAAVGLLSPLVVRPLAEPLTTHHSPLTGPRYELVAGERRKRALDLLGESHAECTVRDLADVDAAEIALLENLDRENLNAAEASHGMQTLVKLGHTPETLAALLRIGEADVAARLKLAALPAFWQAWLRKERDPRRGVAAERLTAWLEFPAVLAAMQPVADRWPMTLSAWTRELTESILLLSRDMDPKSHVGPTFRMTTELRGRLQVRELRVGDHVETRALNTALWDELQDRGNAPPVKRRGPILGTPATGRVESGESRVESNGDAGDHSPAGEPLAIADQGPDDGGVVSGRLERWTDGFLRECLHRVITNLDCTQLYALAEHVGVDLKKEFRCTRSFLNVFGGRELLDLADGWGIRGDVADARDLGELKAAILALRNRCSMPQCVSDVCTPADAVAV